MRLLRNDVLTSAWKTQDSIAFGLEKTHHRVSEMKTRKLQVKITKSLRYTGMQQQYIMLHDAMSYTFKRIFTQKKPKIDHKSDFFP